MSAQLIASVNSKMCLAGKVNQSWMFALGVLVPARSYRENSSRIIRT